MSHTRELRKIGRVGLIATTLGLALAAGLASPALAAVKNGPLDKPQPLSKADRNTGGANGQCPGGPYCSTRYGSASRNGNGKGASVGKPCAGCVGKADNKNPRGQMPNGSDRNAGFECDRNHGIGRSNPAHTGCKSVVNPPNVNPPKANPPKVNPPKVNPPKVNPPKVNPPNNPVNVNPPNNPPNNNNPANNTPVGRPVVLGTVVDAPLVLGAAVAAPQAGAPGSTNPLPSAAAAGEANTGDQLFAGGFAAFAALLAFGAGVIMRRRYGDT